MNANQVTENSNSESVTSKKTAAYSFAELTNRSQPYRILIVDDTPDVLELLKVYLAQEGYTIATASNGKEALVLLDEFLPDVMVVDFLMPGMDGQELARRIRARQDLLYVPIVMLTAVSGVETVKLESFKSGVDAFLTKPVKHAELKVIIRTMLRIKVAQDNMLAALDRVAEAQDELLQFERQRGQFEAMQNTMAALSYELTAPLNAADAMVTRLEQLMSAFSVISGSLQNKQFDNSNFVAESRSCLSDLQKAITEAKESLSHLSEDSKKAATQFARQR